MFSGIPTRTIVFLLAQGSHFRRYRCGTETAYGTCAPCGLHAAELFSKYF